MDLKGKEKSDADTQWEHTTTGPDGSTGDASGGGVYFKEIMLLLLITIPVQEV